MTFRRWFAATPHVYHLTTLMQPAHSFSKRALDLLLVCPALLVLSPLLAGVAIAIRLESRGPVIYRQTRLGLHGKPFVMFKFRSMVEDAESHEAGLFTYEDDPRVTRVGHWIRKTSIDELPQLFNILKGQMSCVGPRPPVFYELGEYDTLDDHTKRRFDVLPGVTGLAQVSGRNELSWDEKIMWDHRYINHFERWGIVIDLWLAVRTIAKVLSMQGSYELSANAESDRSRVDLTMRTETQNKSAP